jgi:hypothetical protein
MLEGGFSASKIKRDYKLSDFSHGVGNPAVLSDLAVAFGIN